MSTLREKDSIGPLPESKLASEFEHDRLYWRGLCITWHRIGDAAFDLAIEKGILKHVTGEEYIKK